MQCMVSSGDLPLNISWVFNGKDIRKFQEISVSKVGRRGSTLMIESTSYSLSGNYTCVAVNKAGASEYTAELLVNGSRCFLKLI